MRQPRSRKALIAAQGGQVASLAISSGGFRIGLRARFVATIFAGSFLLFLVQPMIARIVLPRVGGAPAVWNSAMLVYQALLLAGYAYAHWLGRFAPRSQGVIQLGTLLLCGLMLPIGLIAALPPPDANPFLWIPWLLALSIGPLFFVVSAQAPLMQRWFALSGGGDPYPLYSASNLGSFCGLIAYPLLLEPLISVADQRLAWSIGYGLLVALVAGCALALPRGVAPQPQARAAWPPLGRLAGWALLAAIPSGLMLSTTLHLTTDIVAMPLLWVLPLGLYLLSFTAAFAERRGAARLCTLAAPLMLLLAGCVTFADTTPLPWAVAGIALLTLFTASVAIHARLFEQRPDPSQLTAFYLAMAAGGVVGGIFCALAAPLLFDWTYEHPLLLLATAAMLGLRNPFPIVERMWARVPAGGRLTRWWPIGVLMVSLVGQISWGGGKSVAGAIIVAYVLIALGVLTIGRRWLFAATLGALMLGMGGWERLALSSAPGQMTRSFFGIYSVRELGPGVRALVHGTTIHGIQNRGSPSRERIATSYYAPRSGIGLALQAAPELFGDRARIAVVGLGTGTLSCYARPGQDWRFFEIDPVVAAIARDSSRFTFLSRCLPNARVEIGDARLLLERSRPASADLLVIDAFSSDSVPMHLLTREAFATYAEVVRPGGLILVHISNRFLNLEPVVAGAAQRGWHMRIRRYRPTPREAETRAGASDWVALSSDPRLLQRFQTTSKEAWAPLSPRPGFAPWTDDRASILPIVKWSG